MNKLIAIIIIALAGNSWAQESFSLADAKAYALENNLTISNAMNDVENTRQRYIEIRGMGLPQVDITGSFNNFINLPIQIVDASFINPNAAEGETISFRAGQEFSASGTLQASQLVFNGSYLVGLKAADYLQKFQATASDISKEDVIFNVIQAYQLASVAKENLVFTDSMVIITQELIDKQANYLELGLMKQEEMDQLNYSLQRIEMINNILGTLKEKYTENNDTYDELFRSYRTLVYSYFQSLEVVSRQIGGVRVDLSHTYQKTLSKPFESVDENTQKEAMEIISKYGFSNKVLLQSDLFPYLQKQRRGFSISEDPQIHERILKYQMRILNHLLHSNVLERMSNSSLYGNEYEITEYMIDLRKSIFESDMNGDVSSVRQYLQTSYVEKLLSIIDDKSQYDLISKSKVYYNLNWLRNNLNVKSGNLNSRQHKDYLVYLIDNQLTSN